MNLYTEIKRLSQVVIEDTYSKKNIREKVLEDIQSSLNHGLRDIYQDLISQIDDYLNMNFYPSKEERLDHLRYEDLEFEDIAVEIFMAVLPIDKPTPIQGLAYSIGSNLGYKDAFDAAKTGGELLALGKNVGLLEIKVGGENGSYYVNSFYRLEDSTKQFIRKTIYLPPMIVPPKKVKCNNDSGYLTVDDSIILGKGNHHHEKQALDYINIANKVRFSLDERMLNYDEEPPKKCDTPQKVQEHMMMAGVSRQVYKDMVDNGNIFYFTHKFDKRGRCYSQGYHVNLQSTEYKKSILNLTRKEVIK